MIKDEVFFNYLKERGHDDMSAEEVVAMLRSRSEATDEWPEREHRRTERRLENAFVPMRFPSEKP